ncbi:MAG: asparagine synthase-related protein, partial [Armatimonadota bacterium]
ATAAGAGEDALMLSGGIDSRLVAGVLARLGRSPEAITLGDPEDQEMRVAATVARRLGWRHTPLPVFRRDPVGDALALRDTEHLSGGFNHCIEWEALPQLAAKPRRLHTGLVGDATMGTSHVEWARDPQTNQFTFESLFPRINRYGFSPDVLREILQPGLREGIDIAMAALRRAWIEGGDEGWRRSWAFDLAHRQRFHVAGMGWRLARGAWTTLPFARRRLRHALAAMPYEELQGRSLQLALLEEAFPDLARLPLDRNSHDTTPLVVDSAVVRAWNRTGARALRRMRRRFERTTEDRRFYYRVHAVDGPGWKEIRRTAEPFREQLHTIFHPEAVERLLPRPEERASDGDGIVDGTRVRTTIGLALWLGENLP